MDSPGDHRLRGQQAGRCRAALREIGGGEQADQPIEGQPMDSEESCARDRKFAHEIIRRLPTGGDDQHFGFARHAIEPGAGYIEARE